MVVEVGLNAQPETSLPVIFVKVFQVYELKSATVDVTVIADDAIPLQIDEVAALSVNAGAAPTVTVTGVLALSQPFTPDSETYNVVVTAIVEL